MSWFLAALLPAVAAALLVLCGLALSRALSRGRVGGTEEPRPEVGA